MGLNFKKLKQYQYLQNNDSQNEAPKPVASASPGNLLDMQVLGTSLGVQWLRLHLSMKRVRVQSLVRELRSYIPPGPQNQNIKQK